MTTTTNKTNNTNATKVVLTIMALALASAGAVAIDAEYSHETPLSGLYETRLNSRARRSQRQAESNRDRRIRRHHLRTAQMTRTFGVELEMFPKWASGLSENNSGRFTTHLANALYEPLSDMGPVRGTNYSGGTNNQHIYDGTEIAETVVSTDCTATPTDDRCTYGLEVKTPALRFSQLSRWLRRVTPLFLQHYAVSRNCGLHVHVASRSPNDSHTEEVQNKMAKFAFAIELLLPALKLYVSKSRQNQNYAGTSNLYMGHWSNLRNFGFRFKHGFQSSSLDVFEPNSENLRPFERPLPSVENPFAGISTLFDGFNVLTGQAYKVVSSHRYLPARMCHSYGTVEIRLHQGTLNPVKIQRWTQLLGVINNRTDMHGGLDDLIGRVKDQHSAMWHNDAWLGEDQATPTSHLQGYDQLRLAKVMWDWLGIPKDNTLRTYWSDRFETLHRGQPSKTYPLTRYLAQKLVRHDHIVSPRHVCASLSCHECGSSVDHEELDSDDYPDGDDVEDYCHECEEYTMHEISYWMSGALLGLLNFAMTAGSITALLLGCGIGAVHAAGRKFNVRNRLGKMLASLSARGNQAFGIGWYGTNGAKKQHEGSALWRVKLGNRAPSKEGARILKRFVPVTASVAMVHTRFATHGSNTDDNAHPFQCDDVLLVHNGVLNNHAQVCKALGMKTTTVDSEAIGWALNDGDIERVVELCEGTMSLIWQRTSQPGHLWYWTNGGNPLAYGRLDDASGPVAVASEAHYLTNAFKTRLRWDTDCTVGVLYHVHPDGTIEERVIPNSAETYPVRYIDWRTGTWVCDPLDEDDIEHERAEDWVLKHMHNHGWDAGHAYHGYSEPMGLAVRPDGTAYEITADIGDDWMLWDTWLCASIALGHFDPELQEPVESDDKWDFGPNEWDADFYNEHWQ